MNKNHVAKTHNKLKNSNNRYMNINEIICKNKEIIKIAIVGIIVGFTNGLIGSFAGVISIIALNKLFYKSQKVSQATTLSYIWILSIISLVIYLKDFDIKYDIVLYIIIGGIIGTFIGTNLLNKLNNNILKKIFAIILIITGIMVIL